MSATGAQTAGSAALPRQRTAARTSGLAPGLLFALAVIGPGDLVSNVAAGAAHGYALVWALGLALVFRFVWLDASARYLLVTGETLLQGYARVSMGIVWLVLGSLILVRHLANVYNMTLMGDAMHILAPLPLPYSARVWTAAMVGLTMFWIFRGGYESVERWLKYLIAGMGGALLGAVVLAKPSLGDLARGLLLPSLPPDHGVYTTILLLTALIGTEAGSLTNVSYSYFLAQRAERTPAFIATHRRGLLASVGSIFAMGLLLQIAAATSLRPLGVVPRTAAEIVPMFSSTLGDAGRVLFGFGLLAASMSGVVAGTTAYALIAADICEKWGGSRWPRAKLFRAFVLFWAITPLYCLFAPVKPLALVLVVNAGFVLLLPMLSWGLLRLTSNRSLMGAHVNHAAVNWLLGLLVTISIYLSARTLIEWGSRLREHL